ncbi:MAG: 2-succinyl-5-enolpyruvyl-6-hydroxy-3-cyclohexene-1-carboxylic-acid synthase [Acidimicrobiales bacterium]
MTEPAAPPTTATATFCATLVDEWARAGVDAAMVAPGSRSTPLALALAADPRIAVHVVHDERAAGFAALGHGLATGRPAVTLCTSGTAATHFHAAVVEAHLAAVPMIVCTADRPPELWGVGAPQTIDQTRLFGPATRGFHQPGVPHESDTGWWRSFAAHLVADAVGAPGRPGPVHVDLSFRDPLVGTPGRLPPGRPGDAPWHGPATDLGEGPTGARGDRLVPHLVDGDRARSGVLIVGRTTARPTTINALAGRLGWPVLADHRSGCRAGATAVRFFDGLLRSPSFAAAAVPEVVVRIGEPLASKLVSQWLVAAASAGADIVAVADRGRRLDPERVAAVTVDDPACLDDLLTALPDRLEPAPTAARWLAADDEATRAVASRLPTEPAVTAEIVATLPLASCLVVASSMPVRDLEWYAPAGTGAEVLANRGANGIDGVVSTAVGVALTGRPTTVVVGDLAFLHDATALIALADRHLDLEIVVIDNDGGGIFSFLPQADALPGHRFEALFGTPHGTDLAALAAAHRLPVTHWPDRADGPGPRVVVVRSDRAGNRADHAALNAALVAVAERHADRLSPTGHP